MNIDLGGPGVACSAMRVRRLLAGELAGEERAKAAAHLLACERCRETERRLGAERAELAVAVPFEAFAAGVAERLATKERRPLRWYLGVAALAAGIALVPFISTRISDDPGVRTKGGAGVRLYLQDKQGPREYRANEPVRETDDLYAEIVPGSRRYALVLLAEGNEVHAAYAGPARGQDGRPLVVPFPWTGPHDGTLYVVLDDQPIDAQAVRRDLRAARRGAEVFTFKVPRAR